MLYKVSNYLYLIRSGQRCKRAKPVLLARAVVAAAYTSLTAFCMHIIAYYIASYIVIKLLSKACFNLR